MRSSETVKLPTPLPQYDYQNEMLNRRSVEQAVTDIRADIVDVRDTTDSAASLALRRHQFLLMGA